MMNDSCRHSYIHKLTYEDRDDNTRVGLCDSCGRRITSFWIDGNDDRPGYWSRWKLETILLVEDDFHG